MAETQEKELATEQSSQVATQEKPVKLSETKLSETKLSENQMFLLTNLTSSRKMSMKDALAIVLKQK